MSDTTTHQVTFAKTSQRHLNVAKVTGNMDAIAKAGWNKSLGVQGWSTSPVEGSWIETGKTAPYENMLTITVTYDRTKTGKPEDALTLGGIFHKMATKADTPALGSWKLVQVDGEEYTKPAEGEIPVGGTDNLSYADVDVPRDWDKNFQHLYGLDSHISRVRRAIEAAIRSDWNQRFHAALIGPPGCGKTDIGKTVASILGDEAVMVFDSTAMTSAGAIKELAEREILPRVIVFEEIEKAPESALQFLLGVLDQRGEIRKVTARSNIQRDTRVLAICTVNNMGLFLKMQAGALASRFSNRIYFTEPDEKTQRKILKREISKIDGDEKWIEPVIRYCKAHSISDPRVMISLALCGTDGWLDGTFEKELSETAPPKSEASQS